jgi:hypothetical protein
MRLYKLDSSADVFILKMPQLCEKYLAEF